MLRTAKADDTEIPREVFQLQKETTKYAKEVSNMLKDFCYGTNLNEMVI